MTAPGALPTKDEIADLIVYNTVAEAAQKILARLRPAWERTRAEGFKVEVADVTNDAATLAECGRLKAERDALRADLERVKSQKQALWTSTDKQIRELIDKVDAERENVRACAEALKATGPYLSHKRECATWTPQTEEYCTCGVGDVVKEARTALARVQEARK